MFFCFAFILIQLKKRRKKEKKTKRTVSSRPFGGNRLLSLKWLTSPSTNLIVQKNS